MNLQRQLDAFRRNQMAVQLASKAAAEKKAVAELAQQQQMGGAGSTAGAT